MHLEKTQSLFVSALLIGLAGRGECGAQVCDPHALKTQFSAHAHPIRRPAPRTQSDSLHAPSHRIPFLTSHGGKRNAVVGFRVQPSSTYSRRALHKVPRWLKRATGLDRRLAHRDVAEISRMLRASQAAEEDARPRILDDAMQVMTNPHSLVSIEFSCTHGRWCVAEHELRLARLLSRRAQGCGLVLDPTNSRDELSPSLRGSGGQIGAASKKARFTCECTLARLRGPASRSDRCSWPRSRPRTL